MDFVSLVIVCALLLVALDVSRKDKNPWVMLSGLILLAVGVFFRVFSGPSLTGLMHLFFEVGLSLMLAAGLLTFKNAGPKPFFMLGALSLSVSAVLFGLSSFFGLRSLDTQAALLVELGPDDHIEEVAPLLARYDATYERAFPSLDLDMDEDLAQVYLVYGDASRFEALTAELQGDVENVDHVEFNRLMELDLPVETPDDDFRAARKYLENDPMVDGQWGLEAIRGHEAHAILRTLTPARKARVAIVDTGVDSNHEDMKKAFGGGAGTKDSHGHGTHCAGIAGGLTNNRVGIASLNWEGKFVEITGYRALNANGTGTIESISQAIIDAAKDGADVISLSLGDRAPITPKVLTDAVAFAQKRHAIVVASSGNSNRDAYDHIPSNIKGVIAVSAVDEQLNKASFSNTNNRLKYPIAAPGVKILSLKPNNQYVRLSGTSMSAPMVSGLLGVLRAINPELTAQEAYKIIHETGKTVAATPKVGRVINAEAAIRAVLQGV